MKFGIMFANVGPYVEPDMAAAFGGVLDVERVEAAILSVLRAGPPVAEVRRPGSRR